MIPPSLKRLKTLTVLAGAAVILLVVLAVITLFVVQQRQRDLEVVTAQQDAILHSQEVAFCTTEFDTRWVFARVLTTIAQDPEDTAADNRRERLLADRLEEQLRQLPEECSPHVDVDQIRIDVE